MPIPAAAPAEAVELYSRQINVLPAVRQPARLAGFRAGWAAAAEAGRGITQQDLDAYATQITMEFSYNQRTRINGFKDGWAAALEVAQ